MEWKADTKSKHHKLKNLMKLGMIRKFERNYRIEDSIIREIVKEY